MKRIRYYLAVLMVSLLFPVLAVSAKYGVEIDEDYYLYRQRSAEHAAMGYVTDLNQRIEKCSSAGNLGAYDYLTNLLAYVLTTGGPFGIRPKEPTQDELTVLNASFKHIAKLSIVSAADEATIPSKLEKITFCNTAPIYMKEAFFKPRQKGVVYQHVLAVLPTANISTF